MERSALKSEAARSLLGNRQFRQLAGAQLFATMAIYALGLAGVAVVEERTQSSAQTGLVIVSSILPAFLGSLIAGAVIDRWGSARVLGVGHLVRAVAALAFWVGVESWSASLALGTVYLVNAVGAAVSQFALSAELSLVPSVVRQESLIPANALVQLGMLIGEGLGIVLLAPLVLKIAGTPTMGLVSALLGVLALMLVLRLPRERGEAGLPDRRRTSLIRDVRDGWSAISQDRLLLQVMIQATVAAAILLVLLSLVPGIAARYLGLSAEDTAFLMLPAGLGFVLGAGMMSRWHRGPARPRWIALGLMGLGIGIGLFALSLGSPDGGRAALVPMLVIIGFIGLSLSVIIIPARVVLQERPPAEMRGRVISAQLALGNAAAVIPLLAGGTLADQFGIQTVVAVLGALALISGLAGVRPVSS